MKNTGRYLSGMRIKTGINRPGPEISTFLIQNRLRKTRLLFVLYMAGLQPIQIFLNNFYPFA